MLLITQTASVNERANLACSLLCNCTYNNTIGITNGPCSYINALINKHSVRNIYTIKGVLYIEIKRDSHFVLGACSTGLLG